MREIRPYSSEGGEAEAFPTPILQPGISMPGRMDKMNYPRPEWTV